MSTKTETDYRSRLELEPEALRRLGHRLVDEVVDHLHGLAHKSPGRRPGPEELADLEISPTAQGRDPEEVFDLVLQQVFPNGLSVQHPRFFAFVPGPSNSVGVLSDLLSSAFNPFLGSWFGGAGPSHLEQMTVQWLMQTCGLPDTGGGLFVSGGSNANLTALAAARHHRLGPSPGQRLERAVAYCSDQTHFAVDRALGVLGLGPQQIRRLHSDSEQRLEPKNLRKALAEDRAAGRRPFCVIANAGSTSTGSVDPLQTLAELCAAEDVWLHVDGAYGAPAVMTQRGQEQLRGLDRVDSLALDPHKWLFQPFACGCVLLREREILARAFHHLPDYLRDVDVGAETQDRRVNHYDHGIELTRPFRALKLWATLQVFGTDHVTQAIDRGLDLAEAAQALLQDAGWEIVTPARMAIVTFRPHLPHLDFEAIDRLSGQVVERALADGFMVVSSAEVAGRPVLRLCTINPRTSEEELKQSLQRLSQYVQELASPA